MRKTTTSSPGATATTGNSKAFEIAYAPGNEIIRIRIQAFWTPESADEYFAALIPILTDQRARFGRAKVLVDRRGGVPQSAETLARTTEWFRRAYQANDASAIVVDASLVKIQLKRAYPAELSHIFTSYAAAEAWLRQN